MLNEFEQRRQVVCREVADLRRNRGRLNQELACLTEEFNNNNLQLEGARVRVKTLNTRFAVIEKKLKEVRTQTCLLHKKRSEGGDEVASLQKEIECTEAELRLLGQRKVELGQRILTLASSLQENLEALETSSRKKRDILTRIDECKLKREALSSEIASSLAADVSEKDRIDTELNDITLLLMNHITERDSLKNVLVENASALALLRERVSALDERRRVLDEAKTLESKRVDLKSSISELRKENELLERKIEEQKGLRASREKKLSGVVSENAEREKAIADLQDKVGVFDDLISHIQDSEARLAELMLSKEQNSNYIVELLAENTRLDSEVRLLEGKIKAMVDLAGSENLGNTAGKDS
jgi:chromosome segregation ATPase